MANPILIGLSGLKAANRGIATTSHNIANVNTDGYTRQRNIDSTNNPQFTGVGYQGTGVSTTSIERLQDTYLKSQLQIQSSDLNRLSVMDNFSDRIEKLVSGSGLSNSNTEFYNALEDAANNPQSTAQAEHVISSAVHLSSQYNYLGSQLESISQDVNQNIVSEVNSINEIAKLIHGLNQDLSGNSSGDTPNDLLDYREKLLKDLSEHISISVIDRGAHSIDVSTAHGIPLVSIVGTHELTTIRSEDNPGYTTVAMSTPAGPRDISHSIGGGTLGGLSEIQKDMLTPVQLQLGRMATVFGSTINQTLQEAVQDTQESLFVTGEPVATSHVDNQSDATANATISDATLLTTSDYKIEFDGAEYNLTRLSDGTSISGADTLFMDGVQFTVSAGASAGDKFLIQPFRDATRAFAANEGKAELLTGLRLDAALPALPVSQLLSETRNQNLFDNATATLGNQFSILTTNVGTVAQTASVQHESMVNIYDQTLERMDSTSGVSLDEEAASLLKYQRGYEASAKVISVANSLFDTLIATLNRTL